MSNLAFSAVETGEDAVAVVTAIVLGARRSLYIYSRELDPGLLDAPEVLAALRHFGTAGRGNQAMVLLQDATVPQRAHAPLIALAQRLPSVFGFRQVVDPVDRAYPSAFIASDAGGFYFRGLGHRFDGEAGRPQRSCARAPAMRQLRPRVGAFTHGDGVPQPGNLSGPCAGAGGKPGAGRSTVDRGHPKRHILSACGSSRVAAIIHGLSHRHQR